jgi:hypothetical protein
MNTIENKNIEILSDEKNFELYNNEYPYNLPMRIMGFEDEKVYFKFIKNCEKIIRSSNEYNEWRKYLKDVLQNNHCLITLEIDDQVTVEIHHHIPSLFTVIKTVTNKFVDNKKEFCSFDICLEVMELHFLNKIGYVPLIKSMHEKLHSGFLKIPVDLVRGNYKDFLKDYGQYIDDDDWEVIKERQSIVISNNKWKKDEYPGIIDQSIINIQTSNNDIIEEFRLGV